MADIYCENCKTTLGWKYVSHSFLKLSPKPFYLPLLLVASLQSFVCCCASLDFFFFFFLASKDKNYTIANQKSKVTPIKALLIKASVTDLFRFLFRLRSSTLWYPSAQHNYSAERLVADSQAGTSESLQ